MYRIIKLIGISWIYYIVTYGTSICYCLETKVLYAESSGIHNILASNITGDVVPSTYPVLKINQSANNDSTFYKFYNEELKELEDETMTLMSKQRKIFETLRKKAKEQNKLFDDLSIAAQRQ